MQELKRISIACLILLLNGFVLWVFFAAGPLNGVPMIVAVLPFFVGPLGTLWMLYDCLRYERKPWPYAILAFVPYVFVWHYFERVRKRGPAERTPIAHRRNGGHAQAD